MSEELKQRHLKDIQEIEYRRLALNNALDNQRIVDDLNTRADQGAVVDVEGLYKDTSPPSLNEAIENGGWNDCLDHLNAQGYLQTPPKEQ